MKNINFRINKLLSATVIEGNKLKLIYDCSNENKIAEIEYIVDLNKPVQCNISKNYDYEYNYYSHLYQKFPTYNPNTNIAFMFETDTAYTIRVTDSVKKMTVEEIEKQLGHKVEIVSI